MCTQVDAFDYQVLHLTADFYTAYPDPPYKEILKKTQRSYNCLLIQSRYRYFICIPYRSEISHNYAYKFKNSQRSKKHKSGLDYTKLIIVSNTSYISSKDSIIDQDEYNETRKNIHKIKTEASEFIDAYIDHVTGKATLSSQEFKRRYRYSPLKYFHNELGIDAVSAEQEMLVEVAVTAENVL